MLVAVLVAVTYTAFWLPTPLPFDEFLALPIARAVADSTLYAPGDLLVSAGLRGPFHLYRATAALYAAGLDVDAWWFAALMLSIAALAYATWRFGIAMQASPAASAFAAVLVCVSPFYRGTINWSGLPLLSFVTASFAIPLAIGALASALAGRARTAAILVGVTFNIHPGAGVIAGAMCLAVVLADTPRPLPGAVIRWCGLAALVALPNVVYIIASSAEAASGTPVDRATFWKLFSLFQWHVYPRDHWREGYAWFALQLTAIIMALRTVPDPSRRRVLAALAAAGALLAVYAANVAASASPAVAIMFWARVSWLVKPLGFVIVVDALRRAWSSGEDRRFIALTAVCWTGAVLHRNIGVGEGLLATAIAAWLLAGRKVSARAPAAAFGIVGVALAWLSRGGADSASMHDLARLAAMAGALIMSGWVLRTPSAAPSAAPAHRGEPVLSFLGTAGWAIVPALFAVGAGMRTWQDAVPRSRASLDQAVHFSRPREAVAALVQWASNSTPPSTMFLLPPDDLRLVPFRLQAGRSVYIQTADIGQLVYDAATYHQAYTRLLATGVTVVAPHTFDSRGYDTLTDEGLAAFGRDGVTYAVFDATAVRPPSRFPIVWRDERWIVYRLETEAPSGNTQ